MFINFTIIPVGSCDEVIHAVASFRKHAGLHRIGCAGLIDADGRDNDQIEYLASKGVYVVPVSEVENLLLMPGPFLALAKLMHFDEEEAQRRLAGLSEIVLRKAKADVERFSIGYTRRRVDSEMKVVGLDAKSVDELATEFATKTSEINPQAIYDEIRKLFQTAVDSGDTNTVLKLYDNKGLLSEAAKLLGVPGIRNLEELVGRALRNDDGEELLAALIAELPTPEA